MILTFRLDQRYTSLRFPTNDQHQQALVVNLIEDAVIAGADAPCIIVAVQFCDVGGARVVGEGIDHQSDTFVHGPGQVGKIAPGAGEKRNEIGRAHV